MRDSIFDKASTKILEQLRINTDNDTPILDIIMEIDKMSETDKIFYEAYKKYGNRNHTWQYFKAMFHGNVENMQTTVKHWKTWTEINSELSKNYDKLFKPYYLKKAKFDTLCKQYRFTPSYTDIQKHPEYKIKYPDLVDAFSDLDNYEKRIQNRFKDLQTCNYSTWNPEIAKLEHEFEIQKKQINKNDNKATRKLVSQYIDRMYKLVNLSNANFVVGERVDVYRKIILENPEILKMAKKFQLLSGDKRVEFARLILNKSAVIFGTPRGKVERIDKTFNDFCVHFFHAGAFSSHAATLKLSASVMFLFTFLEILAHEDAHRVDYFNPHQGMIGTQVMKWVVENISGSGSLDRKYYYRHPSELSSYYIGEIVSLDLYTKITNILVKDLSEKTKTITSKIMSFFKGKT